MKRSATIWIAYAVSLVVMVAVMSWVTVSTLQLEHEERTATLRAENERLALWRMESALLPLIMEESSREIEQWASPAPIDLMAAVVPGFNENSPVSELVTYESAAVALHFQIDATGDWHSPQLPDKSLEAELLANGRLSPSQIAERHAAFETLKRNTKPEEFFEALRNIQPQPPLTIPVPVPSQVDDIRVTNDSKLHKGVPAADSTRSHRNLAPLAIENADVADSANDGVARGQAKFEFPDSKAKWVVRPTVANGTNDEQTIEQPVEIAELAPLRPSPPPLPTDRYESTSEVWGAQQRSTPQRKNQPFAFEPTVLEDGQNRPSTVSVAGEVRPANLLQQQGAALNQRGFSQVPVSAPRSASVEGGEVRTRPTGTRLAQTTRIFGNNGPVPPATQPSSHGQGDSTSAVDQSTGPDPGANQQSQVVRRPRLPSQPRPSGSGNVRLHARMIQQTEGASRPEQVDQDLNETRPLSRAFKPQAQSVVNGNEQVSENLDRTTNGRPPLTPRSINAQEQQASQQQQGTFPNSAPGQVGAGLPQSETAQNNRPAQTARHPRGANRSRSHSSNLGNADAPASFNNDPFGNIANANGALVGNTNEELFENVKVSAENDYGSKGGKGSKVVAQQAKKSVAELRQRMNNTLSNGRNFVSRLMTDNGTIPFPFSIPSDSPGVAVGPMTAFWLNGQLFLARKVVSSEGDLVQGCMLSWTQIRKSLQQMIVDLLPNARLVAMPAESIPNHLTLATLPLQLEPGEIPAQPMAFWSPIRSSLAMAWMWLSLSAAAIGGLLYGVIRLSDRRAAFVSAVTHELRTPLTTFQLYADLLSNRDALPDDKYDLYVGTLRNEAERLGHLVENVLSWSRLERQNDSQANVESSWQDIVNHMRQTLNDRASQASMILKIDEPRAAAKSDAESGADQFDDSTPMARDFRFLANPASVEQILFNLVDNACKYARPTPYPVIEIDAEQTDSAIVIQVKDHGPGISDDVRKRLFQPFSKSASEAARSAPGVGLGLSLCRRLARNMNGDLTLESSTGNGVVFRLTLPLSKAASAN